MSAVERKLTRESALEYAETLWDVFTPDGYAGVVAYVFVTRDAVVVSTREHERVWRFDQVTYFEQGAVAEPDVCLCGVVHPGGVHV